MFKQTNSEYNSGTVAFYFILSRDLRYTSTVVRGRSGGQFLASQLAADGLLVWLVFGCGAVFGVHIGRGFFVFSFIKYRRLIDRCCSVACGIVCGV